MNFQSIFATSNTLTFIKIDLSVIDVKLTILSVNYTWALFQLMAKMSFFRLGVKFLKIIV